MRPPRLDQLDDIDRNLVALLQVNARESVANLARQLGVARTTVIARIARLESSNVIAGYSVRLGQDVLDSSIQAYVGIMLAPKYGRDVQKRLAQDARGAVALRGERRVRLRRVAARRFARSAERSARSDRRAGRRRADHDVDHPRAQDRPRHGVSAATYSPFRQFRLRRNDRQNVELVDTQHFVSMISICCAPKLCAQGFSPQGAARKRSARPKLETAHSNKEKNMKVAIVGAGLIGQTIAHMLRETGDYDVVAFDRDAARARRYSPRRASRRAASIPPTPPRCAQRIARLRRARQRAAVLPRGERGVGGEGARACITSI